MVFRINLSHNKFKKFSDIKKKIKNKTKQIVIHVLWQHETRYYCDKMYKILEVTKLGSQAKSGITVFHIHVHV